MSYKPAARVADMHSTPMQTPTTPPVAYVGGLILSGVPHVLIEGLPAATVTSSAMNVGGPPDTISVGSNKVMIGGKPAARVEGNTAPDGKIVKGASKVYIG